MKFIGNILSYIGLYFVYMGTIAQHQSPFGFHLEKAIGPVLIGILFISFGQAIVIKVAKADQAEADHQAAVAVANEDFEGKALYLRSFELDGMFIMNTDHRNLFSWEQYDRPGTDTIERIFYDATSATYPLIGLGGRGDIEFGIAAAGLSSDWEKKVRKGVQQCSLIFIVPLSTEGVMREVRMIIEEGALSKTIFIMPPDNHMFQFRGNVSFEKKWIDTVKIFDRELRVILPAYSKNGLLFTIDRNLCLDKTTDFGCDPKSMAKYINRLT